MVKARGAEGSNENTRDYKTWSKFEEQTLVQCMREVVENHRVQNGNFKLSELKQLERMMHERVADCNFQASHIKSKVRYFKDKFTAMLELKQASGFGWDDTRGCIVVDDTEFAGWVQGHPKASGLNNKPLLHWDDLCIIFGVDQAIGAEAVQPGDAASKLMAGGSAAEFMDTDGERMDSYNIPSDMDHNAVMEDIINQGIDIDATSLRHIEAEVTSKRVQQKGKGVATSSGSKRSRQQFADDNYARIAETIALAGENFAKIAANYCIEGELTVKRQFLYDELSKFTELTIQQRTMAMRHLYRDDGDATIFFHLPTDEEKLDFIFTILG
ncbi:hypothetical protein LINGRAHAP2_LOCUS33969 [Linum grandiflorum]